MKKYLCTLFDINYLPLGLALYSSLTKYFDEFHLWILALDDSSYEKLNALNLQNVTVLALSELEEPSVLEAKSNRTWQEYCWTLSPVLPSFVLENNQEIDHIAYIDSDIFFFNSPDEIYREIAESSIMIIPHRFPERLKHYEENGIYNVQMVYFKRDAEGLACLSRWRSQCLDWCYYKNEPGRFGDQKYLDEWPILYKNVCILKHIGAGVALWNLESYNFSKQGEEFYVNDLKVIFYHYHQYKFFSDGFYIANFHNYNLKEDFNPLYREYTGTILFNVRKYNLFSKKLSFKEKFYMYGTNPSFYHHNRYVNFFYLSFRRILLYLAKFPIIKKFIHKII